MDAVGAKFGQLELAMRCLAAIAENSPEAVAAFSLDGALVYSNSTWARVHGYQKSRELVGKPIGVFQPQEGAEPRFAALLEEVKSKGRLTGVMEHKRADGTKFSTETTLVRYKDGNGEIAGLIAFMLATNKPESAGQYQGDLQREIEKYRLELSRREEELVATERHLTEQLTARDKAERQSLQNKQELEQLRGKLSQVEGLLKEEQSHRTEMMQSYEKKLAELMETNRRLREEVKEFKHREVEFFDDIVSDKGTSPRVDGLDPEALQALSEMAKKYVHA